MLIEETVARLRDLGAEWLRLLDLRVEQARLRLRGIVFAACIALWLVVALVLATALALARVIAGLAGLLAGALGSAWAGDLAAGSIVLGGIVLLGLAVHLWIRRAGLARLRQKYPPDGA